MKVFLDTTMFWLAFYEKGFFIMLFCVFEPGRIASLVCLVYNLHCAKFKYKESTKEDHEIP